MARRFTVPEVLPIVHGYRDIKGNSVGGALHITLDDGNIGDDSVKFCGAVAIEKGDLVGAYLAMILLHMSKTQRGKLSNLFYVGSV